MMNHAQNYSLKTINLMIAFRKYLDTLNCPSVQQYFEKEKFGNPGQISKFEFQKIIQHLQPFLSFNPFDIISIFKQLDEGWDFIFIKKFIYVYKQITTKIPSSTFQEKKSGEQDKKRIQEEKERKNRIIKIGLKKLQSYILENDSMAMFQQFDVNNSGRLNINEFNKLLISTGIKQFEDRTIRKILLVQIYSYFPSKHISKEQFIRFFKIPKENIQNKKKVQFYVPTQNLIPTYVPDIPKVSPTKYQFPNKTHQEKKIKIPDPTIKINIVPTQNKNITFDKPSNKTFEEQKFKVPQPPINTNIKPSENKNVSLDNKPLNDKFKKKNTFAEENNFSPIKKPIVTERKDQLIDAVQIFPQSSRYFRNGQPGIEELRYFEELQYLLSRKKIYKDSQNPQTSKGQYYPAINFFKGQNYHLFQMAQSVLQREISRIGLARQIEPKDIIQGEIGDCYFLSSIASLISIYPEVISQKFLFNENPANYFVVKIFMNGQWKYITTDDWFPSRNGKQPVFAKPHGKQIWVMLLQKCWAKCFGNFESIVSGSPRQAFIALTGAPTQYFSLKSKQTTKQVIQQKIKEAYECRYVVTASGSDYLSSLSENEQQKIGLISNHAYSFLKFINANGNSLVKIRNPWGTRIWKGDWSFESNKWTKQLRNKYNYNRNPDDGSFYLSMNDFLKYFGSFVICKVNPIYSHTTLNMNYKKHKSNYTRMKVSQSGKYIISLYQENDRNMRQKYSNYDYSPARVILMKVGEIWQYIDSFQNTQSYSTSIEVQLKEGSEYIISTKVKWKFWAQHKACLTVYGPDKVIFQPSNNSIASIFKNEMIESFYKKNRGKVKDYNKTGAIGSYSESFFSLEKGIGYYFITNPSQKKWELSYSLQGEGIKVIKPDKLPFSFVLTKGARFLKGFFTSPEGYNYQSSETMTY